MLSASECQDALDSVTLRWPLGMEFEVNEDPYEGVAVWIFWKTLDSDKPGKKVALGVGVYLPPAAREDEQALHEFMVWRIGRLMVHEILEFYRVDGECVVKPGHQ